MQNILVCDIYFARASSSGGHIVTMVTGVNLADFPQISTSYTEKYDLDGRGMQVTDLYLINV